MPEKIDGDIARFKRGPISPQLAITASPSKIPTAARKARGSPNGKTGRGKGISRLNGYQFVIGKNHKAEAICLVWHGESESEVTPEVLAEAANEVTQAGLKRPFRIYGTFCRVADTRSWRFYQIPDEILAQLNIEEELEAEEACQA